MPHPVRRRPGPHPPESLQRARSLRRGQEHRTIPPLPAGCAWSHGAISPPNASSPYRTRPGAYHPGWLVVLNELSRGRNPPNPGGIRALVQEYRWSYPFQSRQRGAGKRAAIPDTEPLIIAEEPGPRNDTVISLVPHSARKTAFTGVIWRFSPPLPTRPCLSSQLVGRAGIGAGSQSAAGLVISGEGSPDCG